MKKLWMIGVLSGLSSCSTIVTPRAIAESEAPPETRERAGALFEEAVELANRFLRSDQNRSLPAGRYAFGVGGNLVFITEEKIWPNRIRNSLAGDLVVLIGFRAQERDDGFVVGTRPPGEYPEIDHSMFRTLDGDWHSPESVASLLLHETAHTVHGEGTVGYGNTLQYYLEAVFLLRASDHSAERIPKAVDHEFIFHLRIDEARAAGDEEQLSLHLEDFEQHLFQQQGDCRHGPDLD